MRVLNTIIDNDRSTDSHGVKSLSEAIENRSFSSNCDKQLNCCTQMNLYELPHQLIDAIIKEK